MLLFSLTIILTILLYIFWLRKLSPQTADGAIVMALGIMINGAFQQIEIFKDNLGLYFTLLLLAFIINLIYAYLREIYRGLFYQRHLENPITSFATGTWIAGISVSTISISIYLPEIQVFTHILFYFNLFLWGSFLVLIGHNYFKIFKQRHTLLNQTYGVLLLAAVATQSIVVSGNGLFHSGFPAYISITLIILGLILYFLGLILILVRYLWLNPGTLADDWHNSNCIIHGAMSITGLASAYSHAVNVNLMAFIWLWILIAFLIVETIEIIRAFKRIQKYGIKKALFEYSTPQWSRNFTFGMFLTFTINFSLDGSFLDNNFFRTIYEGIIIGGKYIVISLFAIEFSLFFNNITSQKQRLKIPQTKSKDMNTQI